MTFVYKIHHIPNGNSGFFAFLAGKLASLRLQALNVSPAAFRGQFVHEVFARMPYQLWIQRLRRDNFHTLVAIAYPEGTSEKEYIVTSPAACYIQCQCSSSILNSRLVKTRLCSPHYFRSPTPVPNHFDEFSVSWSYASQAGWYLVLLCLMNTWSQKNSSDQIESLSPRLAVARRVL
jgi:hypothetical protein